MTTADQQFYYLGIPTYLTYLQYDSSSKVGGEMSLLSPPLTSVPCQMSPPSHLQLYTTFPMRQCRNGVTFLWGALALTASIMPKRRTKKLLAQPRIQYSSGAKDLRKKVVVGLSKQQLDFPFTKSRTLEDSEDSPCRRSVFFEAPWNTKKLQYCCCWPGLRQSPHVLHRRRRPQSSQLSWRKL